MTLFLKFIWNAIFKLTGLDISNGVEYKNFSFYMIELKADFNKVKEALSEKHFLPQDFGEGETRIQIIGCDMRDVEILGPYKEVSIQVPIEPLKKNHSSPYAHLYLPVTTEAARWPGVDIAGFPKFIADIEITNQNGKIGCRLSENHSNILEFSADDALGTRQSITWAYYGIRRNKVIETDFKIEGNLSERNAAINSKLMLGDHPIGDALKALLISDKVIRVQIGHNFSGFLQKPVLVG